MIKKILGFVILIVGLIALILFRCENPPPSRSKSVGSDYPSKQGITIPDSDVRLIDGNPFLKDYGHPDHTATNDLTSLLLVLQDCQLIIKDFDRHHLPGNAEIVSFLQGNNPDKLAWLPKEHPLISNDGVLLDRTGEPIFFHRISGTQFELRSAGDDKTIWTDDDVVVP